MCIACILSMRWIEHSFEIPPHILASDHCDQCDLRLGRACVVVRYRYDEALPSLEMFEMFLFRRPRCTSSSSLLFPNSRMIPLRKIGHHSHRPLWHQQDSLHIFVGLPSPLACLDRLIPYASPPVKDLFVSLTGVSVGRDHLATQSPLHGSSWTLLEVFCV